LADNTDANLRERLREATAALHASVETRLDIDAGIVTPNDYAALLARFFGFYAPVERGLSKLDWRDSGLDFSKRLKAGWIEADLADFGVGDAAAAALPEAANAPQPETILEGLGVLYVLEGATLGGQVVLRRLGPRLGVHPCFGGRFFSSYGSDVGRMWRQYLSVLGAFGQKDSEVAAIERAAVRTFRAFDVWLSPSMAAPGEKQTHGSWRRHAGGEGPT
jgi:heme oxygenase